MSKHDKHCNCMMCSMGKAVGMKEKCNEENCDCSNKGDSEEN